MTERRVDYLPLDQVEHAARNPKKHAKAELAGAISRFGLGELPLLDDRTGRLVAGHGRINDLRDRQQRGLTPPDGIRVDDTGGWLVPVIRGWASDTDEAAEAYLVASNRMTTLGGWDDTQLGELLGNLNQVDPALLNVTGFTDTDLADLLRTPTVLPDAGPGIGGGGGGGSAHRFTITAPGDLWALGEHRLLCGDATNPEHVDQVLAALAAEPDLVHTAPPIAADGDGIHPAGDAYRHLAALLPDAVHVWWRAQHYTAAAGLDDQRCWLVWTPKARGDADEAILAWTTHDSRIRTTSTGKDVPAGTWPAQVAEWALDVVDRDRFRTTVLDPFARTGWTLLAAQATDRTFAGIEKDPGHVDTACRRWQQATARRPERIHPDGGREPVDFT